MRKAILEVTGEMLRTGLMPIFDHGLTVVDSLAGDPIRQTVRLVIAGDTLPAECEGELKTVSITIHMEAYGQQRLVKVSDIAIVPSASALAV